MKLETTHYRTFITAGADGQPVDADSLPTVAIFENGVVLAYAPTVTDIGTGVYSVAIAKTTANGFEVGKSYSPVATAVVSGTTISNVMPEFEIETNNIDDVDTAIDNLNDVSSSDVQTAATAALNTYDPPTKAELDSGLAALNDLDSTEVQTAASAALTAYDPPTRTEATADKDAILADLATRAQPGDEMSIDPNQDLGNGITVGPALKAAWTQGFGRWVLNRSTKVLTLYGADGIAIWSFQIDSVTSPLVRTPI